MLYLNYCIVDWLYWDRGQADLSVSVRQSMGRLHWDKGTAVPVGQRTDALVLMEQRISIYDDHNVLVYGKKMLPGPPGDQVATQCGNVATWW